MYLFSASYKGYLMEYYKHLVLGSSIQMNMIPKCHNQFINGTQNPYNNFDNSKSRNDTVCHPLIQEHADIN